MEILLVFILTLELENIRDIIELLNASQIRLFLNAIAIINEIPKERTKYF